METRTFATNEIVDKGRGSAVSLSHENYINLRLANEGTGPGTLPGIMSKNQGAD